MAIDQTITFFDTINIDLMFGGVNEHVEQCLGLAGLGGKGGFERLHYLIEDCFEDVGGKKRLHFEFLKNFDSMIAFDAHPLYALLQEPIYSCGQGTKFFQPSETRDGQLKLAL